MRKFESELDQALEELRDAVTQMGINLARATAALAAIGLSLARWRARKLRRRRKLSLHHSNISPNLRVIEGGKSLE